MPNFHEFYLVLVVGDAELTREFLHLEEVAEASAGDQPAVTHWHQSSFLNIIY
jgi:hypothetical protein